MSRFALALTLYLLLILGCGDDPFQQVVDIDLPDHEPAPAVSVELVAGDTAVRHYIARSYGTQEERTEEEREYDLVLYRDGAEFFRHSGTTANFGNFDQEWVNLPLGGALDSTTARYRIEVNVAGIGAASAEETMPARAEARILSYEPDGALSADGERVDALRLEFTDPPGPGDYYAVRVGYEGVGAVSCRAVNGGPPTCDSTYADFTVIADSPNPLVRELGYVYQLGLSDASFDGQRYVLDVQFSPTTADENPRYFVEVFTLPEAAYRYLVSYEAYQRARGNPFAEPVTVTDNITDGYGYFIVANRQRLFLD